MRRPLLYLGFVQGLAGGALGLAILAAALAVLNVGVRELAQTYGSSFVLPFLPWGDALSVVGFSGFLGWLGSAMSVSRHLR